MKEGTVTCDLGTVRDKLSRKAQELWDISIDLDRNKVELAEATSEIRRIVGYIEGIAAIVTYHEIHEDE